MDKGRRRSPSWTCWVPRNAKPACPAAFYKQEPSSSSSCGGKVWELRRFWRVLKVCVRSTDEPCSKNARTWWGERDFINSADSPSLLLLLLLIRTAAPLVFFFFFLVVLLFLKEDDDGSLYSFMEVFRLAVKERNILDKQAFEFLCHFRSSFACYAYYELLKTQNDWDY